MDEASDPPSGTQPAPLQPISEVERCKDWKEYTDKLNEFLQGYYWFVKRDFRGKGMVNFRFQAPLVAKSRHGHVVSVVDDTSE